MILGFLSRGCHASHSREWLIEALKFAEIQQEKHGISLSRDVAYRMLLECTKNRDLGLGRRMHSLLVHNQLDFVTFMANHLIRLFASCGCLFEANRAFGKISNPDHYSWNAVIDAHSRLGEGEMAIHFYDSMQQDKEIASRTGRSEGIGCLMEKQTNGLKPDKATFLSTLKVCITIGTIEQGRLLHEHIIDNGLLSDIVVASTLVNMYAKCGTLEEAHGVFHAMPNRNVVSWGAMITGYTQHGKSKSALNCFEQMQHDGISPSKITFLSALKACSNMNDVKQGRCIHQQIFENGFHYDIVVGSTLIDMYAKCGYLDEAHGVLDSLPNPNVVSWGAMLAGYAQHGEGYYALQCFEDMKLAGINPDKIAFLSILKACSSICAVGQGRCIHESILQHRLEYDIAVGTTLVHMYATCGNLEESHRTFCKLPKRNVVLWSAMIAGYIQCGESCHAFGCFDRMQDEGIKPDKVTFLSILKACGSISSIEHGRHIHEQIIECGLQSDDLGNTIIDMYGKCGTLEEARRAFDMLPRHDVVSWSVMIAGFVQQGEGNLALEYFCDMQQIGIKPIKATFLSVLKACTLTRNVEKAEYIHDQVVEEGLRSDIVVGSALVDMYAKFGNLEEARKIFDGLQNPDPVLWSAMIAGYAQNDEGYLAYECFQEMQYNKIKPDKGTILGILRACGSIGAVEHGRRMHEHVVEDGLLCDIVVGSTLVDMYAKCGSLEEAHKVFLLLSDPDLVSWGAMIAGYAQLGEADSAVQYFESMQRCGIKPDDMAFSSILSAFSRSGFVDEALGYFKTMREWHRVKPDIYHITCMVDLLGRSGHFGEAENLLDYIMQHDICIWTTLLNACAVHGNVHLGRRSFDAIFRLDPHFAAAYVLMSNIYANAQMKQNVYEIEVLRQKFAGASGNPGMSWIQIDD